LANADVSSEVFSWRFFQLSDYSRKNVEYIIVDFGKSVRRIDPSDRPTYLGEVLLPR